MTTTQDPQQMIRHGFDAFQRGDLEALAQLCADDAVWHGAPGATMISGDFRGREAILDMIRSSREAAQNSIKFDVKDVLSSPQHVVVIAEGTARREGRQIGGHTVFVFQTRGGKVSEVWVHGDTNLHPGWEEFWHR